jgi:hypothetical protein
MNRLLIVDSTLSTIVRKNIKTCLDSTTQSIELDLSDSDSCVDALSDIATAAFVFESIGIVTNGTDTARWNGTIMDTAFADGLAGLFGPETTQRSIDLFATNQHVRDVVVTRLSRNLGAGTSVFFSTNRTGSTVTTEQDWEMEQCLQGGRLVVPETTSPDETDATAVPAVRTRNVRELYLNSQTDKYAFTF